MELHVIFTVDDHVPLDVAEAALDRMVAEDRSEVGAYVTFDRIERR